MTPKDRWHDLASYCAIAKEYSYELDKALTTLVIQECKARDKPAPSGLLLSDVSNAIQLIATDYPDCDLTIETTKLENKKVVTEVVVYFGDKDRYGRNLPIKGESNIPYLPLAIALALMITYCKKKEKDA